MVGLGRLELPTPALSERCSNQLSYKPKLLKSKSKFVFLVKPELLITLILIHIPFSKGCIDGDNSLYNHFSMIALSLKGGDPAARSRTATLL